MSRSRNLSVWETLKENRNYQFAFLKIDVVGHSEITATWPYDQVSAVFDNFEKYVERQVDRYHGRIWSWHGDGGLCTFWGNSPIEDRPTPKARNAYRAAESILAGLEQFNRRNLLPAGDKVRVRIGIHLGDAVYRRVTGRIHSEDINFVSHLEAKRTHENSMSISLEVHKELEEPIQRKFVEIGTFERRTVFTSDKTNKDRFVVPAPADTDLLRGVSDMLERIAPILVDIDERIKDRTQYVLRAANLYGSGQTVYSLLSGWQPRDEYVNVLSPRKASGAITFLGPIERNQSLLGVLWRLRIAKRSAGTIEVWAIPREKVKFTFIVGERDVIIGEPFRSGGNPAEGGWYIDGGKHGTEYALFFQERFKDLLRSAPPGEEQVVNLIREVASSVGTRRLRVEDFLKEVMLSVADWKTFFGTYGRVSPDDIVQEFTELLRKSRKFRVDDEGMCRLL